MKKADKLQYVLLHTAKFYIAILLYCERSIV